MSYDCVKAFSYSVSSAISYSSEKSVSTFSVQILYSPSWMKATALLADEVTIPKSSSMVIIFFHVFVSQITVSLGDLVIKNLPSAVKATMLIGFLCLLSY
jgi:hypothetical protein